MTSQSPLILKFYAPPLVGDDRRTIAAVHRLERALTGLRLEWRVKERRRLAALPNREVWLTEAATHGELPMICNGDERYPVMISGNDQSAYVSPGGRPQFQIHAELPLDAAVVAAAAEMLEGVAESTLAFWGHATPEAAALDIDVLLAAQALRLGSSPLVATTNPKHLSQFIPALPWTDINPGVFRIS